MNILFFAERIVHGGGEKVRNWLACKLLDQGHNVIYAAPSLDEKFHIELKSVGLAARVTIDEYPYFIKKRNPVLYCKEIADLYKRNKVNLMIYFGGSLLEQLVARSYGIKVLLSERCEPASRSLISQILKQIQFRVADGYVFQTPEASQCYGERANRLSTVIPNPIIDNLPAPLFSNLRKEIVTVGRLSKEKNQLMLIESFADFHKIHPDYVLKIYGSGPLESMLQSEIYKRNIQDFVEIIKGKRNISELINGAELFVLPSNTEGMPNALIEAMSVGLLCISTNCPIYGPKMLIENGVNAYLTPVKDSKMLLMTMCKALENKEKATQIRHNAVKIRERLEESKIADLWIKYIDSLFYDCFDKQFK